ncbi:MAG TPA: biotin--[acetyl-CoA-carboxylase] ligase [Gallionella sp.]|nr:biotin--[acetyl-CoA-carboxylase] ligase [Gallionella sp.]
MNAAPVQVRAWRLLELLADGEFHSGEELAQQLGLSRASVFNAMESAAEYGIELQRIRGRGYRLARPWQRLERDEIVRLLGREAACFDIEVLAQATSSNALLLQRAASNAASGTVLAVELQTAGRGRLGRTWHSGLGNALTFSLLWRFECGLNALSGLSLAVGVAIVRALNEFGTQSVRLKWPNDVLIEQGKLAGVLIEAQGDMLGPSAVVIGIGLNCTLPARLERQIGQPAGALDEACNNMPSRNRLLATLLRELASVLQQFGEHGFASLRDEWERYHAYQHRQIQLHLPDGQLVSGIARGVSDTGELRVETAQGLRQFNSGEVGGLR